MKRRTFTGCSLGLLSSSFEFMHLSTWAANETADLVLKNGTIITMKDTQPDAQACAVKNGRFLAVGSNGDMEPYTSRSTRIVDLKGKGVSPGLIDAHSHVIAFGQMEKKFVILRPPKVNSFETMRAELARAAGNTPEGEWIVGRGWDTFKEGRFPQRQDLDEAVPKNPVLTIHWSGQYGVANTLALQKAALFQREVKDPYGGKFLRDPRTGLPNGILMHYPAIYAVYQPELNERDQYECALWGFEQFLREGVTCIHDNFCPARYSPTYVRMERSGRLSCRIRIYPYVKDLQACQMLIQKIPRYRGDLVRLQGIKLAIDGYALMYEIPAKHRNLVIPMHSQEQFQAIVSTIHNAGFQADVHAVGDKGVDWTLEAFLKASGSNENCRRMRHRIEHFPMRKQDTIRHAGDMGVPVCVQPIQIVIKADDFSEKFEGSNHSLVDGLVPMKSFEKAGVHVAFGADVPAFPTHRPLDSIRAAMERRSVSGRQLDTSESITFLEGLRHHTLEAAYAAFDETELGSIEAGKIADFVVWNKDLHSIKTTADVATLSTVATCLNGETVFGNLG